MKQCIFSFRKIKHISRFHYVVLIDLEMKRISTKWKNGLGADLNYIDLLKSTKRL